MIMMIIAFLLGLILCLLFGIPYIDFLKNNKEFVTTFYEIGDGISISKKITKKIVK